MQIENGNFTRTEWDEAAAGFRDLSLLQSWAYGEARAADGGWRVERAVLRDRGAVVGMAQVMRRDLPLVGGGLAWINRGPLFRPVDGDAVSFTDAVAALRAHYVGGQGCYLRIAPPVAGDEMPEAAALRGAGFASTDTAGWASARLGLGPTLDVLRAALNGKWRNGLNRAERAGVQVSNADGGPLFDRFLAEYDEFVTARGFDTTVTSVLLARLQDALPPGGKLRCFCADREGEALGSVLIVSYGDHAEYLSATLLPAGRPRSAGQILLWHAIEDAKARGCTVFDLGGMDPDQTAPGVFKFKSRVNGVPYRLANEIESTGGGPFARLVRWRVGRARAGQGAG